MGDNATWLIAVAVFCTTCSLLAAIAAVSMWRAMRSGELGRAIVAGDTAVKAHADERLDEIRGELGEIRGFMARIEAHQDSEEKHALRPRDLAPIHERLNRLGEQQAESRGELLAAVRALNEQLRILQNAQMTQVRGTH